MKKHLWKFLLILGMIPFIIPIVYGLYALFFGFTFMFNTTYGFEGMFDAIFIWSFLFWQTYIIGAILIIISIVLKKKNNMNNKKEE